MSRLLSAFRIVAILVLLPGHGVKYVTGQEGRLRDVVLVGPVYGHRLVAANCRSYSLYDSLWLLLTVCDLTLFCDPWQQQVSVFTWLVLRRLAMLTTVTS